MGRGTVLQRLRAIARPIVKAARAVWWVIRYGPPALARWLRRRAARAVATLWLAGLAAFVAITGVRSYETITVQAAVAREKEAEREKVQVERQKQLSSLEFRDIDEMELERDKKLADLGIFEMPEEDDSVGECMMSPDQVTQRMRAVAKIRAGEELTVDDRKALQPPDPETCVRAPKDEDDGGERKKGLAGWISRNRKHMNRPVSDAMTLELLQKELKGFKKEPGDPEVSVDDNGNLVVVATEPGAGGAKKDGAGEGDRKPDQADDASANLVADSDSDSDSDTEATDGSVDADEVRADAESGAASAGPTASGRGTGGERARLIVVGRAVKGVDGPALGRAALGALVPAVLALAPEQAGASESGGDGDAAAQGAAAGAVADERDPDKTTGPSDRARLRGVAEALVIRAGPRDLELAAVGETLHVLLPADSFRADRTARLETGARWLVIDIGDVLAEHDGLAVRVVGDPVPSKGSSEGIDPARSRRRAELVAELLGEGGLVGPVEVKGLVARDQAPNGDRVTIVVALTPPVGDGN